LLDRLAPNGEPLRLMLRDPALLQFVHITDSAVYLYASAADRKAKHPETVIYADEYAAFAGLFSTLSADSLLNLYARKGSRHLRDLLPYPIALAPRLKASCGPEPLEGVRIAIDPGHIAGTFAEAESLEYRFMKIRPVPSDTTRDLHFWEADLTFCTARLLQKMLEKEGAIVFLARTSAGRNADGFTFEEWKATEMLPQLHAELSAGRLSAYMSHYYRQEATQGQIFRDFFTPLDLRRRAALINAFRPDMTVLIHYNAHISDIKDRDHFGFSTPCKENYQMAFVPGAFMGGELSRIEDRLALLRLLLTDDVAESVRLSGHICGQLCSHAGIPQTDHHEEKQLPYLAIACTHTGTSGVYARNLSLTRMIHGTLCYGEPLCQNNEAEAMMLAQKDYTFEGIHTSSRVKTVAEAYYQGIVAYLTQ